MVRWFTLRIALLWVVIISVTWLALLLTSYIQSSGTLILTHNIFLDRHERFVLVDIDRKVLFSFSPETGDDEHIFAMLFSPEQQLFLKIGYLADNTVGIRITDLRGDDLIPPVAFPHNNIQADSVVFSQDGNQAIIPAAVFPGRIEQFVLDINTGILTPFYMLYDDNQDSSVAWSPDDSQIAYLRANGFGQTQITLRDIAGDEIIELTHNDYTSYCPSWSPDGKIIAYLETYEGIDYLRYITVGNTSTDELIGGEWHMTTCPQWTANGRYLTFIALDTITLTTEVIVFNPRTGRISSLMPVDRTASLAVWR